MDICKGNSCFQMLYTVLTKIILFNDYLVENKSHCLLQVEQIRIYQLCNFSKNKDVKGNPSRIPCI